MQISVKIIRMMMMTMMIKKRHIFLVMCFLSLTAFGQKKDFGIWYGVSAEHKLTKKLEIDLSTDIRTFNNASKIEEAFLEGGITYSLTKHIAIAASYRLTDKIENNNSYYYQHKFFLDLKGNVPMGNISFSGRLRFQARTKTYIEDDNDNHPDYTGRIKVKAVYKTPVFPISPYVYVESFCPMFPEKTRVIEKNRFSAGLEFNIAKHHSAEIEYIFQRDYLPHLSDLNIISINYNIKF
jgi:hypothetical protein